MSKVLRSALVVLAAVGAAAAAGALQAALRRQAVDPQGAAAVQRPPRIHPDYSGITIPPNIAPLNFCVDEPGRAYHVTVSAARGEPIRVTADEPKIVIPPKKWRVLLNANQGDQLRFDVCAQGADGSWQQYEPITNTIAREPIDSYLVYRLMNVIYNYYQRMKLCEHNIESAEESVLLDSRSFGDGCMNCHMFLANGVEKVAIQIRQGSAPYGSGMLLIQDGVITKVDARTAANPRVAAFASWHPSGRALVFSTNKVRQFFHSARKEVREGIDLISDLSVYVLDTHSVLNPPSISRPDQLETWPTWSADGRYLYYCNAPLLWTESDVPPPPHHLDLRYDLMRIAFDVESRRWGDPETVLSAGQARQSITLPRSSPDGKFLLFCMSKYGGFPALQPDADLYMMDLASRRYWRLECNSDEAESWHAWSSNSRWIVFSSKRVDKIFMKAYLCYVDEDGHAQKPFVLPQKDPAFYDSFIRVYNVPEFAREPMPVRGEEIAAVIRSAPWARVEMVTTAATPASASPEPGGAEEGSGAEPWEPFGR